MRRAAALLAACLLCAQAALGSPFSSLAREAAAERRPARKIALCTRALAAWSARSEPAAAKAPLYLERALALAALGRSADALKDYDAALAVTAPGAALRAPLRAARSRALALLGRCAEARDDARAAVRLSSGAARGALLVELGGLEGECLGDYGQAARDLDAALDAAATLKDEALRERAVVALGLTRCRQGRFSEGEDLLERARLLAPKDAAAAFALAVCRQDAGDAAAALPLLDEAADAPGAAFLGEARFRRGQVERSRGERLAAGEDFKEACRLGFSRACRALP